MAPSGNKYRRNGSRRNGTNSVNIDSFDTLRFDQFIVHTFFCTIGLFH